MKTMEIPSIDGVAIPAYLSEVYWWAYVHPRAVSVFERQWLVNLILWGNFARLRNAAISMLSGTAAARTLQIACVYGDLTPRLAASLGPGTLDVLDVLPIQLRNLARKLPAGTPVRLLHADAAHIPAADASYDQVLIFFLLHEQPEAVRRATLAEATRVLKPGGRMVIVDYHEPHRLMPLRPLMRPLLARLEPYALDLWREPITNWLPSGALQSVRKRLFYGGLYQIVEGTR